MRLNTCGIHRDLGDDPECDNCSAGMTRQHCRSPEAVFDERYRIRQKVHHAIEGGPIGFAMPAVVAGIHVPVVFWFFYQWVKFLPTCYATVKEHQRLALRRS